MLNVGLRPHESYELVWADVGLDEMTVTARPRKKKADKPRIVEITSATRSKLAAHRRLQKKERLRMGTLWPADYRELVFVNENGRPLDGPNMRRLLNRWTETAEINKRITPYDLRHTVASLAADAGVNIVTLADYLGNDQETLLRYYRKPVTPVMSLGIDLAEEAEGR